MTNDEREALIEKARVAYVEAWEREDAYLTLNNHPKTAHLRSRAGIVAALGVFEQAQAPTGDEQEALANLIRLGFYRLDGPPDDEDRAIADVVLAAGFRRPAQDEPTTYEPVINDGTDDAWQVIADALGNLGYDLNSHEETAAWVQQYLFRRTVQGDRVTRAIEALSWRPDHDGSDPARVQDDYMRRAQTADTALAILTGQDEGTFR